MALYVAVALTAGVLAILSGIHVAGCKRLRVANADLRVRFHHVMVAVRFTFTVAAVALYTLSADNADDRRLFAAIAVGGYLTMLLVTTLIIKE